MSLENDFLLELDPEAVNGRGNAYASLTDEYEVPLFTDLYEEQCEQSQREEKREQTQLYENVFCKPWIETEDTELLEALFQEDSKALQQGSVGSAKEQSIYPAAIGFGILIFGALILIEIRGYRKRKKKYDN